MHSGVRQYEKKDRVIEVEYAEATKFVWCLN